MTCIIEHDLHRHLCESEQDDAREQYFLNELERYLNDLHEYCPVPFILPEFSEHLWNDRARFFRIDGEGELICSESWQDYLVQHVPQQKYYTQLKRIMPSMSESDRAFLGEYLGV
jgi:hypothetical protein